ncbi:MAG TPA: hypothetical protein VGB89_12740 [Bacteroidota bacterium]
MNAGGGHIGLDSRTTVGPKISNFDIQRRTINGMLASYKQLLKALEEACNPFLEPKKEEQIVEDKELLLKPQSPLLDALSYWISELEDLEKQTGSIIERLVR